MEISKIQAPHAHRSNVVRRVLKVLEVVLYAGDSEWCVTRTMGAGVMLWRLFCILVAVEGELRLLEVVLMLEAEEDMQYVL